MSTFMDFMFHVEKTVINVPAYIKSSFLGVFGGMMATIAVWVLLMDFWISALSGVITGILLTILVYSFYSFIRVRTGAIVLYEEEYIRIIFWNASVLQTASSVEDRGLAIRASDGYSIHQVITIRKLSDDTEANDLYGSVFSNDVRYGNDEKVTAFLIFDGLPPKSYVEFRVFIVSQKEQDEFEKQQRTENEELKLRKQEAQDEQARIKRLRLFAKNLGINDYEPLPLKKSTSASSLSITDTSKATYVKPAMISENIHMNLFCRESKIKFKHYEFNKQTIILRSRFFIAIAICTVLFIASVTWWQIAEFLDIEILLPVISTICSLVIIIATMCGVRFILQIPPRFVEKVFEKYRR